MFKKVGFMLGRFIKLIVFPVVCVGLVISMMKSPNQTFAEGDCLLTSRYQAVVVVAKLSDVYRLQPVLVFQSGAGNSELIEDFRAYNFYKRTEEVDRDFIKIPCKNGLEAEIPL